MSRSLRKVLIRLPQGQKSAGLQLCRGVNPATKQRVVFVSKIVKDGPAHNTNMLDPGDIILNVGSQALRGGDAGALRTATNLIVRNLQSRRNVTLTTQVPSERVRGGGLAGDAFAWEAAFGRRGWMLVLTSAGGVCSCGAGDSGNLETFGKID